MKFKKEVYDNPEFKGRSPFFNKMWYRPDLGGAVTFELARAKPTHRWFYYKQGFSPELIHLMVKERPPPRNGIILDPFCGVGSTMLASQELGYDSIGVDILPLATFISKVKLRSDHDPKKTLDVAKKILSTKRESPNSDWPKVRIIEKAFTEDVGDLLLFFKDKIREVEAEPVRQLLLLCLLSIIDKVSFTKKDGGFLRLVPEKHIQSPDRAFWNAIKDAVNDVAQKKLNVHDGKTNASVTLGDARKLAVKSESVSMVVTSPPYLNKTDYTRIYSLELCFAFVRSFDDLKRIRYNSIRSNVEARYDDSRIPLPGSLLSRLDDLKERQLTNPRHPEMIEGYFEDMYLALKELARVVKHDGVICFVVQNSRFSGIHFETDLYCAEIAKELGLDTEEILVALIRGTSPQQARKYGEIPLRESILVFRKS